MYNFRYHLITIVAIFAALAIGLLLGVAITGSDLVKDASTNLAESLTKQFDELNAQNNDLSEELEVQRLLSSQVLGAWQSERLKGRTIVVLTQAGDAGTTLSNELALLIKEGGGVPIPIRVNATTGFGLNDEQELATLKALLPEVEGEAYEVTLARALAAEWSTLVPTSAELTHAIFEARYPLTNELVKSDHLSISADYQPLRTGFEEAEANGNVGDPTSSAESSLSEDAENNSAFSKGTTPTLLDLATQRTALDIAQELKLPYGVNGVIDASFSTASGGTQMRVDEVSLQIASTFDELGISNELPYLLIRRTADASEKTATEANEQPALQNSYFALLVGDEGNAGLIMDTAQSRNLPCVLSALSQSGHYSVIAMLSGAERGTYGLDSVGAQPLPLIPTDKTGDLPFTK